jgi:hypothetical protein
MKNDAMFTSLSRSLETPVGFASFEGLTSTEASMEDLTSAEASMMAGLYLTSSSPTFSTITISTE